MQLEAAMEQLAAVNQEVQAATRVKSEFLANMSHEIRTPMTSIFGFAESLMDGDLTEEERDNALEAIRRNGAHLLLVLNDILDISKIEAGKLDVEWVACSPMEILRDVRALMAGRAEAKKLRFSIGSVGRIPDTIESDPTRLRQILLNLVSNAIKFTSQGSVRLIVRSTLGQKGQTLLSFDVIDTGIGIKPEQMARLFQPFIQADTSTTRQFGGTGLGLSISRRLAEMLGGDITLESQPGQGSIFRLTILAGPAQTKPGQAVPVRKLTARDLAARTLPSDCRILVAEDGLDNQQLITYLLSKAGAEVVIAENGQAAIEQVQAAQAAKTPFDVILMDMQMPVLDGYEATRKLTNTGCTVPIIALTAHALASDRQKCLTAGCKDFVTKPIDRQTLFDTITRHLHQSAACPFEHTESSASAS